MKKTRMLIMVVMVSLWVLPLCGNSAGAIDLVEPVGNGNINWSQGVIQSKGIGAQPEKY